MDVHGKNVVLTGTFSAIARARAGEKLTELGARVKGSVSARTDLVFAGEKAGSKADRALALGVPVHDEAALLAVLAGETAEPVPAEAAAFPTVAADADTATTEKLLREADWSAFDTRRDLPGLRAALSGLEAREGVTAAHRLATARLRQRGAVLLHPDGHQREPVSHALSPDGRYLALGSMCGDDYERGGAIQIWEVATGRCVNMLDGIFGGQGWDGYRRTIQWSADGRVLAAEFNTNMVGRWDPFGDQAHPPLADVGHAGMDGMSRPVGFALHPDGSRILLLHNYDGQESGVRACLAPLLRSNFRRHSGREPDPILLAKPKPALREQLHGAALMPHLAWFSADGDRVWAYGEWSFDEDVDGGRECAAVSIDMATRRLDWFFDTGFRRNHDYDRMSVSPDETLVALHHRSRLVFLDAVTGAKLAEAELGHEAPRFVWGGQRRLAVVDTQDNGGVDIFDGTRFVCHLPLEPKPTDDHVPDGSAWAWSPDGERAACLTIGDRVELLDLGRAPTGADGIDTEAVAAPEGARGLWWGAGDVLVMAGPRCLRFHDLNTDTVTGDFRFGHEVDKPRPLWNHTRDLGQRLRPNPTFALGRDRWAVAFAEGVVIAPDTEQSTLDEQLAWAVDRRHSWPYRWGEAPLADGVASAFEHLTGSREAVAPLRNRRADIDREPRWPPPDTATVDDLYRTMAEEVARFGGGWAMFVARALRHAARQRARAGRIEAARLLLTRIPGSQRSERALGDAEVALVLAAGGHREAAGKPHRRAVETIDNVDAHQFPFAAAAIGAGYHALGFADPAQEWIERAVAAIDPHPNRWQHRLGVCWALLEGGCEDRARALWTEGEPGQPFHVEGWLAHLNQIGRDDLIREFTLAPDRPWRDNFHACDVFVRIGRADLVREWLIADGRDPDAEHHRESLRAAERNAAVDRPTAADLDELRHGYAELLRQPLSQRREDTKRLVLRAAACHHYSGVLALLEHLPDDREDYNDRASVIVRALWTALTGVDDDAW